MANAVVTSLGRVQPIYRGNYVHGTEYSLLDNVLYNGSTYVSLVDNNKNHYHGIHYNKFNYKIIYFNFSIDKSKKYAYII